jgi:hypothetical protein
MQVKIVRFRDLLPGDPFNAPLRDAYVAPISAGLLVVAASKWEPCPRT